MTPASARTGGGSWHADLLVIIAYVIVVDVVVLAVSPPSSLLRTALVLPMALFVPGYALLALVYPERYAEESSRGGWARREADDGIRPAAGLSGLTRALLSIAFSLVIVPLVVFVLNFVVGIYLAPILLGVSALTVLMAGLALALRARLPANERFRLPHPREFGGGGRRQRGLGRTSNRRLIAGATNPLVLLVGLSVVALLGSVAFAAALPLAGVPAPGHAEFTELYLLTENESGEFVITDQPRQFAPGESQPVYVTIGNHEGETVEYTVVTQLQQVENGEVQEERELTRFTREADNNETVRIQHDLQPPTSGENLRVVYLLYEGEVPSEPSQENAYRSASLWITVGGGGDARESVSAPAATARAPLDALVGGQPTADAPVRGIDD